MLNLVHEPIVMCSSKFSEMSSIILSFTVRMLSAESSGRWALPKGEVRLFLRKTIAITTSKIRYKIWDTIRKPRGGVLIKQKSLHQCMVEWILCFIRDIRGAGIYAAFWSLDVFEGRLRLEYWLTFIYCEQNFVFEVAWIDPERNVPILFDLMMTMRRSANSVCCHVK